MMTPLKPLDGSQLIIQILAVVLLSLSQVLAANAASEQVFTSGNERTTLVELFTSQGCSSCPPAERWLGKLQGNPLLWKGVVPVAFHVDYWDYIGWQDSFARPAHSDRQRQYRSNNAIRSVYTPGFVVNGREWRGWFSQRPLPTTQGDAGELQVVVNGRHLKANYSTPDPSYERLILNVALLAVGLHVDVNRGENSGRRLSQDFVVLQHLVLPSTNRNWEKELPKIDIPADARPAIAVWVSPQGSQRPLQALGGWLE
jgi:hypothetical protein